MSEAEEIEEAPPEPMREVYQELYTTSHYGQAKKNCCPGVRYFPLYCHWLQEPVIDLGCGTGDTVDHIRKAAITATGLDWIQLDNPLYNSLICIGNRDISKEILNIGNYHTSICLDVFEHLTEEQLQGVIKNMQQTSRQVITVYSGSHRWTPDGPELHINQKTLDEWDNLIRGKFLVKETNQIDNHRMLFLCQRKKQPS